MIKTGQQIIEENTYTDPDYNPVVMSYKIAEAIDTQLAEILAVCEPLAKEICTAPNGHSFFLHSHLDVIPFKDLIAKLKEAHGKDTAG